MLQAQNRPNGEILADEVAEIDLAASLHPLCQGTDTTAAHHENNRLAGCGIDDGFLLQVWHLATLRLHVTVANIVACKRRLSRDHADFTHRGKSFLFGLFSTQIIETSRKYETFNKFG
jgi:hypothetical protein